MKFEYIKGHDGKKIVDVDTVDINKLQTDKEIIEAYNELSKASHWRRADTQGDKANALSREIVDEVRTRLNSAGWHAHIFKTGSCECSCSTDLYLHAGFGDIEVSEVPFADNSNLNLTPSELFKEDGSLRTMQETLKLLRDRIGEDALDLDDLAESGEISSEVIETVKAIVADLGGVEVHSINEDGREFTSGAKTYTWMDNEDTAEETAREYLEDGELWKMAVDAGNTTDGLSGWIDTVLNIDGWEPQLCTYDGCSHFLVDGTVYWRCN